MNARERLFAALRGEATDRAPVWLLFPYHQLGCYVDVRTHPQYRVVFEASHQRAIMLDRRSMGVSLFDPEVRVATETERTDGATVTRRVIEYRGRRLAGEVSRGAAGTRVRKAVCTDEDLEFFCSLPLNLDPERVAAELDARLPRHQAERAEFPAELGATMLSMIEPIAPLYHWANLESFALWSLTREDLVASFLDRVMAQLRLVYDYCLSHRMAEVYFLVGSEMASPPLVSRRTFQRWVVPHATELIARIRGAGCYVIQHYHGQIRAILPDFLTMGADALHTIESPPIGDCPLGEAFDVAGDRLTLIGNIQYDEFRRMTSGEMRDEVIRLLEENRGRRFILSPTAGPYEESVSEQFIRNYLTLLDTAWDYAWARGR